MPFEGLVDEVPAITPMTSTQRTRSGNSPPSPIRVCSSFVGSQERTVGCGGCGSTGCAGRGPRRGEHALTEGAAARTRRPGWTCGQSADRRCLLTGVSGSGSTSCLPAAAMETEHAAHDRDTSDRGTTTRSADWGSAGTSQRNKSVAVAAPASCAPMNPGTSPGRMPANVSVSARAIVTAGFANDVDAVNQYAAAIYAATANGT